MSLEGTASKRRFQIVRRGDAHSRQAQHHPRSGCGTQAPPPDPQHAQRLAAAPLLDPPRSCCGTQVAPPNPQHAQRWAAGALLDCAPGAAFGGTPQGESPLEPQAMADAGRLCVHMYNI
eukprot:scaffold5613_cov133-Isochrysis_galbana.AAC.6